MSHYAVDGREVSVQFAPEPTQTWASCIYHQVAQELIDELQALPIDKVAAFIFERIHMARPRCERSVKLREV